VPRLIVLDDFEDGVGGWSLNDPYKARDAKRNTLLVDAVATRANNPFVPDSKGAGLFTFKAANRAWASASRAVDGTKWAAMNAPRLTFYLAADGESRVGGRQNGVDLILRAKTSSGTDEAFRLPTDAGTRRPLQVKLDRAGWRRVAIPLSDFSSTRGRLNSEGMKRVYLLQVAQTGVWDSRFFSLDSLQVESGAAAPTSAPTPRPAGVRRSVAAPTPDPNAAQVSADFLRVEGRIAGGANASLGVSQSSEGADLLPLDNSTFRDALAMLGGSFVRLDAGELCDLVNSSAPEFDFTRLKIAVGRARAIKLLPLVAVPNPPAWALDTGGYAEFARGCALALNGRSAAPAARYFELQADSVTDYNAAFSVLKDVNRALRVGGIGEETRSVASVRALVGGARGLDFLSVADFGLSSDGAAVMPSDTRESSNAARLRAVAEVLRASKFRAAPLYVTRANVRSVESDASVDRSAYAASWWAAYLANSSRLASQVFHEDAANPAAGLLSSDARAYASYYAMYLWNTYFPGGSERVRATSSRPQVVVTACNTPTAHNLLLVNTGRTEQTAQIAIRGFPVLRSARMQLLESASAQPRFVALPKSPYQSVTLRPYSIAVVQFIEGDRRKR
jgi:hypothetical protein